MRASLTDMSAPPAPTPAEKFGEYLAKVAPSAGYDLSSGSGGRAHLAKAAGMSPSAISRALDGKTLPKPSAMNGLAKALGIDPREMLIQGGVISDEPWTESPKPLVVSADLTPEGACDAWGIHHPLIRRRLISDIEQAQRAQAETDADGGATAARG